MCHNTLECHYYCRAAPVVLLEEPRRSIEILWPRADCAVSVRLSVLPPAAAECPQQQREEASVLPQGEGEEEGQEVGEQPRRRREQREPGGPDGAAGGAGQRR